MPKSHLFWVRSEQLRHSGIWGAADETALNKVHQKPKKSPLLENIRLLLLFPHHMVHRQKLYPSSSLSLVVCAVYVFFLLLLAGGVEWIKNVL